MSKFKVGDEVAIAAVVKITAIQPNNNGTVSYSTDRGISIHEKLLEQIEIPAKPTDRLMGREEPKPQPAPKFKVGDRVTNEKLGTGIVSYSNPYWTEVEFSLGKYMCDTSRLFPAPEPKYYTGKVVCISGNYKVGKIYTVVNGLFNEVGFNRLGGTPYTSVDDMNSTFCFGKFAEVKE